MNSLAELLDLAHNTLAERNTQEAARAEADALAKETARAEAREAAIQSAQNHLGQGLFLDLITGQEILAEDFYKPIRVTIPLKHGLRFWVAGRSAMLVAPAKGQRTAELSLPNTPTAIALFVHAAIALEAEWQAAADADRARKVAAACDHIRAGGKADWDSYDTPQEIRARWNALATEAPALWADIEAAYADWLKTEAQQAVAHAAAEAHQDEVQSKTFYPFRVWRLTYAARASDEPDAESVFTDYDYSLTRDPNENGFWPVVKHGRLIPTVYPVYALAKIEQVDVEDPHSPVAGMVCAAEMVDGVLVKVPPARAVVLA